MYKSLVYHVHTHMKQHSNVWKRMAVRWLILAQSTSLLLESGGYSWSYPVKEVTKPTMDCKKLDRKDLSSDCKIALPLIAKANYAAYSNNQTDRLVYSVLRGSTYSDWRDKENGTHEGVDIVSSQGTPIYAIEDGEVIKAGPAAWYGNLVTIKHTLANKTTIQSIYGHLSKVQVSVGDIVKEGQQIGEMGHEGNAQGNHLHFAINTTKDNTYYLNGCGDYPKTSDYTIVESWLCRDLLFSRTVDPIAFIEYKGLVPSPLPKITSTLITKSLRKPLTNLVALSPTPTIAQVSMPQKPATIPTISTSIVPTKTPPTAKPVAPTVSTNITSFANSKVSESFLQNWRISAVSSFGGSLPKWWSSTIIISVVDANGKAFAWVLDKEITITPSKQIVVLSPRVIRYVTDGKVVSFIEAKEKGTTNLVMSYGNTVIGTLTVNVQ